MDVLREKMRADRRSWLPPCWSSRREPRSSGPSTNAYQSDMITHYDRLLKLIDTFGKNYETMSDEMSMKL